MVPVLGSGLLGAHVGLLTGIQQVVPQGVLNGVEVREPVPAQLTNGVVAPLDVVVVEHGVQAAEVFLGHGFSFSS